MHRINIWYGIMSVAAVLVVLAEERSRRPSGRLRH